MSTIQPLLRRPPPAGSSISTGKPVYFVIRQHSQPWSTAAEVCHVCHTLITAEDIAVKEKARAPGWFFGVVKLLSEARTVAEPVKITRVEEP